MNGPQCEIDRVRTAAYLSFPVPAAAMRTKCGNATDVPDKLVDLEEVKATSDPGEFRFGVAESANGNASPQTLRACPTEAR
jgi:hypothetical protein